MKKCTPLIVAVAIPFAAQGSIAQEFDHEIDTVASSVNLNGSIVFDSSGTIIGDYDSKSNPEGTRTLPGLFGGSGNNPIGTSVSVQADTALNTDPVGSFGSSIDLELGSIEIEGLSIDLLDGNTGGTSLSVSMLYETFRSVNPSFLYPGGIPFTIPFGEIGSISQAIITQTDLGVGTITSTEIPGFYNISILITAQLDMQLNASLPGQDPSDTPIEALPLVLPATGTLEVREDNTIEIIMSLAPDPIEIEFPIEDTTLPSIPFELPTFSEETASVIYTATPESISINATIAMNVSSVGTLPECVADMNNDGDLNFFDVSAFLAAFSSQDPIADFNNDDLFNFFDVSAFLAAFSAGCP